jgi:hypothetical protein
MAAQAAGLSKHFSEKVRTGARSSTHFNAQDIGVFYYIMISVANLVSGQYILIYMNNRCPLDQWNFLSAVRVHNVCLLFRIYYVFRRPRQVISAINIPLSVMLGPVLACRLVSHSFNRLYSQYRVFGSRFSTFASVVLRPFLILRVPA